MKIYSDQLEAVLPSLCKSTHDESLSSSQGWGTSSIPATPTPQAPSWGPLSFLVSGAAQEGGPEVAAGGASQLGVGGQTGCLVGKSKASVDTKDLRSVVRPPRSPPPSLYPQAEHPLLPLFSAGKDPPAGQQREPGWCPGFRRSLPEREEKRPPRSCQGSAGPRDFTSALRQSGAGGSTSERRPFLPSQEFYTRRMRSSLPA